MLTSKVKNSAGNDKPIKSDHDHLVFNINQHLIFILKKVMSKGECNLQNQEQNQIRSPCLSSKL
jgi:hypothetical protein